MPFSSPRRPESIILFLSFAVTFCTWAVFRAYTDADDWVNRTIEVRRELTLTLQDVTDVQRGQRGYLITGKNDYLGAYQGTKDRIEGRIVRLKEITKDNKVQQERIAQIENNVHDLLDELNWTVVQMGTKMKDDAYKMVDSGRGERAMRAIRADVDDCTREEDRLLSERMRRETLLFRSAVTCTVVVGVMFGMVLVSVWSRIRVRPVPTVYMGPERRKR